MQRNLWWINEYSVSVYYVSIATHWYKHTQRYADRHTVPLYIYTYIYIKKPSLPYYYPALRLLSICISCYHIPRISPNSIVKQNLIINIYIYRVGERKKESKWIEGMNQFKNYRITQSCLPVKRFGNLKIRGRVLKK